MISNILLPVINYLPLFPNLYWRWSPEVGKKRAHLNFSLQKYRCRKQIWKNIFAAVVVVGILYVDEVVDVLDAVDAVGAVGVVDVGAVEHRVAPSYHVS